MLQSIISKLTNVSFIVASAVVCLAILAMYQRDTFGIKRLIGGA